MEQFTYIISHNLRSPVSKIIGLTDLFERDKDNSDVNKYIIDSLSSEAYHLDNIIKDLNAIINLKTNLDEVKEVVDFQATLNPIKELLEKEISAVELVMHEDFSQSPSVYAIKSYIHSILLNLLTNAIKYRSTDRTLEIHVESKIIGEFVMLSFTDNGLGIDLEKYRDTIFGLFKRFHHHIEGKGMGLHITKTQVEMMGGKMDVESEVNVGTTFIIYLPQVDL
jgi:signal transduction histidine kinase